MIVERSEVWAKLNRYWPTDAAIHLYEDAGRGVDREGEPGFHPRAASLARLRARARSAAHPS